MPLLCKLGYPDRIKMTKLHYAPTPVACKGSPRCGLKLRVILGWSDYGCYSRSILGFEKPKPFQVVGLLQLGLFIGAMA